MLAGCSSSSLLSPRHRLRSESPAAQFQACHFPSMNTQRLDLPCSFPRKDTPRPQSIRPVTVGLSVEKQIDPRTTTTTGASSSSSSYSLKQSIRLPPSATTAAQSGLIEGRRDSKDEFWDRSSNKCLKKRFAEQVPFNDDDDDEICMNRVKRKRGIGKSDDEEEKKLSLCPLGNGNFWLQQGFDVARSLPLITGLDPPFSISSFSGEEDEEGQREGMCFVPPVSLSLPLLNNPWVVSVVTDLGEKNTETETSHGPAKETSGSSDSSESHGLILRLNENNPPSSEHEIGNGSSSRLPNTNPPPSSSLVVVSGRNHHNDSNNRRESEGFELISLLVACVEAIGTRNIHGIHQFIARLGDLASPRGSPISRLTAYFTEALSLRVARLWPHVFHISPPRDLDRFDDDSGTALRLLNQVTPIPRFVHFTSNEFLLRAFEGKDRVHIIDFDIKQGLQWPSLFQSLASRTNPPSHVRITGIGDSKQELIETGDRLAGFAEALNLPFEFHPVVDRLEDVRLWMLHVKEKECVAVNCIFQLHKMLYDSTGGVIRDFLGLIRSTNPSIVLMAEQEADHNDTSLETRICNALTYYSAIFDSLYASIPDDDSPIRIKIEEMYGREIRNIVACEGRERFERHQSFGKWKKVMEQQGGFRCIKIKEDRELLQSRMLLKMYNAGDKYKIEIRGGEDDDGAESASTGAAAGLTLSWLDQPLYTVAAWEPVDVAGGSSSSRQVE